MAEEEELEEEEEEKKAEDDECDDWLFYEGDTDDSETEGEFLDYEELSVFSDDENEDGARRRCLEVPLCHNTQHHGGFIGSRFIELFKVRLKFNDKLCNNKPFTNSRIFGEIVTGLPEHSPTPNGSWINRDNLFPISYYCASRHNTDLVLNLNGSDNKSILLPISGPKPRPPLYVNLDDCVYLQFALKIDNDEDIFSSRHPAFVHANPLLFGDHTVAKEDSICFHPNFDRREDGDYGPFASECVLGYPECDRILVCAHYAVHHGSCATIDVTMLKKGVSSFYGVINARICVFYSRIRLLTIQREGKKVSIQREDKGEVECGGRIKLTRSVVAVPNYASLIIGAELYNDDHHHHKSVICRGRTAFAAKPSGDETSFITCNGEPTLEVRIQWRSQFPCFTSRF